MPTLALYGEPIREEFIVVVNLTAVGNFSHLGRVVALFKTTLLFSAAHWSVLFEA